MIPVNAVDEDVVEAEFVTVEVVDGMEVVDGTAAADGEDETVVVTVVEDGADEEEEGAVEVELASMSTMPMPFLRCRVISKGFQGFFRDEGRLIELKVTKASIAFRMIIRIITFTEIKNY